MITTQNLWLVSLFVAWHDIITCTSRLIQGVLYIHICIYVRTEFVKRYELLYFPIHGITVMCCVHVYLLGTSRISWPYIIYLHACFFFGDYIYTHVISWEVKKINVWLCSLRVKLVSAVRHYFRRLVFVIHRSLRRWFFFLFLCAFLTSCVVLMLLQSEL